jgi:hypothetical protein
MKRETKTKVQHAATSTTPRPTFSPKNRAKFGRFFPLAESRKEAVLDIRTTGRRARIREDWTQDTLRARRRISRAW